MTSYRKVGIASLIMMASVLLSRVIGLAREMVIAYAGGAGPEVDAYQVAFVIPEILNHLLASGFLSVTFIPIFSRYLAMDLEAEGWRVCSIIFTCFGSLLILLIIAASILAPQLIDLIAPGLDDPVLKAKAVRMTRIVMPAQFFFFTGGLFMAVQFARERFTVPALAPLVYNLGIIGFGALLSPYMGMEGFSWGALIGALAGNCIIQFFGARRVGMVLTLRFEFRHRDLKAYVLASLPLMVGLTMSFSTEFFLKFFGSYLPSGSIAALTYDLRIMFVLVGFFGQAVGTASFPYMARLAAENRLPEMNALLNITLKYLAAVIPFSVLFMVLRYEIVLLLFQRGRFDAAATALTARLLFYLMAGTVAFSAQSIVIRAYFAVQNTLFPSVFCSAGALLSIPVYVYNMQRWGADGIAAAISLSVVFQVWLLYALWNYRSRNLESAGVYRHYLKLTVVSAGIGVALERFRTWIAAGIDTQTPAGALAASVLVGTVFLALLLGAARLFRIREIEDIRQKMLTRVRTVLTRARPSPTAEKDRKA
ncbi:MULTISPECIES: murein biosynthesis integral membrane protein MurJ [Desulfococcus]|jgi:putative peptidoglycan lipid II flippase|uniref:Probable lipid II flippase MurJ n=1 Tax=Desulfococcus multivorans DSM 2059 TaxID=1121405 RepID=S7TM96_DESML|nr:murein biosynthesis integral membrane protein MurJ [Desulfococcus multivorans]AOY59682.1 MviN: integral membrane protein [Desulfococcus multivorans]AQV01863.1 lipid II flippase MurJ [Desulfococcus multivorans]EPR37830.1 integral membrane protein MviN [Desulfococcus multivorans DSM 2059]MDX9818770.1 murein biosynthesis integral membrane protein MurJ [Desulfococcus multivorans]SKA17174.1 putative peptidoglycan lipid II flippase [Desulfococcus multivorans DSM 2059]